MSLEITGTITKIHEEIKISDTLNKRLFEVKQSDRFAKNVCFALINKNTDLIDAYAEGQEVVVSFNVDSNEHAGRFYHNVNAWKIQPFKEKAEPVPEIKQDQSNDLPF